MYLARTTSVIGSLSSFSSVSFPFHSLGFSPFPVLLSPRVGDRDNSGTRVEVDVPQVDVWEGVDGLCDGDDDDGGGTVRVEERLGVVGVVHALGVVEEAGILVGVVGLEGVRILKMDGLR